MASQGWAAKCEDLEGLRAQLGAREFPINKLALTSKIGPDKPPEAPRRLGPPALPRERFGPPGRARCAPE
eukprot:824549-Alexandrium_andersonii.AAC.1